MKKILIINGDINAQGGAQVMTRLLSSELQKYYVITVLNTYIKNKVNNFSPANCKIKNLNYKDNIGILCNLIKNSVLFSQKINITIPQSIVSFSLFNINYLKKINANNYDCIIGVEIRGAMLAALLKKYKLTNARIIGWQHNTSDCCLQNTIYGYKNKYSLFYKLYKYFDYYITVMPHDVDKLKLIFPDIKTQFISNFILNKSNKTNLTKNKENLIISSGRLDKVKQFDLLIKAFANIKHKDYKLIILGEGSERSKLLNLISNYNLSKKVLLPGYIKNPDEFYSKSKIFVCSSKYESFGLVSVEAMNYGLPVVSFDFPAAKFISGEEQSLVLVPQNDIKKLSEKIDELIDNQDFYNTMTKKSIERSKYFSKERIIPLWLNVIEGNY